MVKKLFSKRALLINVLSILVCCALLAGTTLAWFTDTAVNTCNRIQAGKLRVDLLMRGEDGSYFSIAGGHGDIFDAAANANGTNKTLWEPGKTQVVYLAVRNKGNLALRYNVLLDITDFGLADALDYAVIKGDDDSVIESWESVAGLSENLGEQLEGSKGRVTAVSDMQLAAAGDTDYYALVVHMKEEAGNNFQNKNVVIDVTVLAIQAAVESDSFSNQYDADADYPVSSNQELLGAVMSAVPGDTIFIAPGFYNLPADLNAEGLSLVGTVDENNNALTTIVMNKQINGRIRTIKITEDNVRLSNIVFMIPEPNLNQTPIIFSTGQNLVVENCTFNAGMTSSTSLQIMGSATIRNCNFIGGLRQIGWSSAIGTVLIENCTFNGASYGIHFSGGNGDVIVRDCQITGNNSFASTLNSVVFERCYFNDSFGGNAIASQVGVSLTDCVFGLGFNFYVERNGYTITANGCSSLAGRTLRSIIQSSNMGRFYFCTLIENGTTYNLGF